MSAGPAHGVSLSRCRWLFGGMVWMTLVYDDRSQGPMAGRGVDGVWVTTGATRGADMDGVVVGVGAHKGLECSHGWGQI